MLIPREEEVRRNRRLRHTAADIRRLPGWRMVRKKSAAQAIKTSLLAGHGGAAPRPVRKKSAVTGDYDSTPRPHAPAPRARQEEVRRSRQLDSPQESC